MCVVLCIQFPCCCEGHNHNYSGPEYCGCFNLKHGFMQHVKSANMKLMKRAGELKSPEWYREAAKALFVCLTEDKHDKCQHHKRTPDYHTNRALLVTCPFHKEALRVAIWDLIDVADKFIDPKFGRCENNPLECNFGLLWRTKMKGEKMAHTMWKLGKYC